ncbi:MAG: SIS domain-containing protein [bacterium]
MSQTQDWTDSISNRLKHFTELLHKVNVTNQTGQSLDLNRGSDKVIQKLFEVRDNENQVLLAGNGGSAAVVSHMHNDLTMGLGLKASVFNESPLLTALANDFSYDVAFEKITKQWAEPGDLFIAVSSSGQSRNILRAIQTAKENNCSVVTFSGFSASNELRQQGILNYFVPSDEYGYVETAHQALTHFITDEAIQRNEGKEIDNE